MTPISSLAKQHFFFFPAKDLVMVCQVHFFRMAVDSQEVPVRMISKGRASTVFRANSYLSWYRESPL